MVLGMSKLFVIILIIAAAIGYGMHNIWAFLNIMLFYVVCKIVWNLLT
jgi:hypothetical protein